MKYLTNLVDDNDLPHCEDGPAIILVFDSDPDEPSYFWFHHGKSHREDGPAIYNDETTSWWINDQRHRMDGPAVIYINHNHPPEWWVRGVKVTDDVIEWMAECDIDSDWKNWTALEKFLFRLRF